MAANGRGRRAKLADTLKSADGREDDDLTESDSDRANRVRFDSDSASDAAEDMNLTSSDDDDQDATDDDDGRHGDLFKGGRAVTGGDDNGYGYGDVGGDSSYEGGESSATGGAEDEPNEEDDNESIDLNDNHDMAANSDDDDSDDDDRDDEDDDEDEDDDDETEDELEEKLKVRQVTIGDLLREGEYEEEEEEVVMKEEQGVLGLFGDKDEESDEADDDDAAVAGNGRANFNVQTQDESAEEDDESAVDSKDFSFTDELLAGSVNGSVTGFSAVNVEQKPLVLRESERFETKAAMVYIMAKVSLTERRALDRGDKLEGPPIEMPITHVDEFKRKFRWPVRVINLPKKDFSQSPIHIYNDYELDLKSSTAENEHQPDLEACSNSRATSSFAHVPSPIVEAAAAAAQQHQASRKRKRSKRAEPVPETVSAAALTTMARIGERFTDRFLESLISDNAAALQGTNNGYSQRDWTPLPVSRKPVANWRFVLENAMKSCNGGGDSSSGDLICPPLRKETLQHIRDRLKTVHSLPWKTADDELFDIVDRLKNATPAAGAAAEFLNDGGILML